MIVLTYLAYLQAIGAMLDPAGVTVQVWIEAEGQAPAGQPGMKRLAVPAPNGHVRCSVCGHKG